MKWINMKDRKPEDKVFWGITEGRDEQGYLDWVIRKFWNDGNGRDYRTLDFAARYDGPETFNGQSWDSTIFGWLPLDAIPDFKE